MLSKSGRKRDCQWSGMTAHVTDKTSAIIDITLNVHIK